MFRKVLGFTAITVVGIASIQIVFGVIGAAIALLTKLFWLGLIAFIAYSIIQAWVNARSRGPQPDVEVGTRDDSEDDDPDDEDEEPQPAGV